MNRASSLSVAWFDYLQQQHITYCVLGDTRDYPEIIASDLDIMVDESELADMPRHIQAFCVEHNLRLVQCLQHEQNARYFVLCWRAPASFAYLAIDVCGDYYRYGTRLLTAAEVLATRRLALAVNGQTRNFYVAAPAYEFIYYLLKRVDKEALDERQIAHLNEQWRQDPLRAARMIDRFWRYSSEARLLGRAAAANDWSAVRRILPRMRNKMRRHLHWSPSASWREWQRRVHRLRHTSGLLLAVLGPDGSGKSSVLDQLQELLAPAFRCTQRYHLRPRTLGPGRTKLNTAASEVSDPHALPPRGVVASCAKLLHWLVDYACGYWCSIRLLLARSCLVLFDRYYHDILVDPRRYRFGAPMYMARWARRLVPQPELWLLLDAPAQVLQARKREVPLLETARQRDAYRLLLQSEVNVAVVDAAQPLRDTVLEAADKTLDYLEQRTARRLHLPLRVQRNPLGTRWLLWFCRHRVPLLSSLVRIVFNCDIYCRLPQDVLMPHPYGIVIHSKTLLGRGVTVMQQVTLGGKNRGANIAPIIGDAAYIGAGAKVLGNVHIGTGAIIGANAVITQDVPAYATVVGANRIIETMRSIQRGAAADVSAEIVTTNVAGVFDLGRAAAPTVLE